MWKSDMVVRVVAKRPCRSRLPMTDSFICGLCLDQDLSMHAFHVERCLASPE